MKVHIVRYTCDDCGIEQTSEAGIRSEGMCPSCDAPMRIEELFSDRRIALLPVDDDRRDDPA